MMAKRYWKCPYCGESNKENEKWAEMAEYLSLPGNPVVGLATDDICNHCKSHVSARQIDQAMKKERSRKWWQFWK